MDAKTNWPFEITGLVLIVAATVTGRLIFGSHKVSGGILAGGVIGIINFKWLGSIVKGALSEGKAAGYTLRYLLKFLFTVTSSALLIYTGLVDPLAFLVGFTIIVVTVSLQRAQFTDRSR